jgi:hypothetical protein
VLNDWMCLILITIVLICNRGLTCDVDKVQELMHVIV